MVRLCSVWMVALFTTVVAKKSSSSSAAHTFSSRRLYSSLLSRTSDRRNAFPQASAAGRSLQVTSGTSPPSRSKCFNASTVNFEDDLHEVVFGSAYQGTCTCMEEDMDPADVLSTLPMAPDPTSATPDEIANYTATFNELWSEFKAGYEFTCTSGCTSCFDNNAYCGILVTHEEIFSSGRGANFTFEEIMTSTFSMPDSKIDLGQCFTYDTGETGEICFSFEFSGAGFTSETVPNCTIRYNDVPCNSCEVTNVTAGCYRADCTNVVPDAMLDECALTGFVGPFRFLQSEQNVSDVTLGTCTPSNTGGATTNGNASTTPTTNGGANSTNGGANSTNGSSSSRGTGGPVITMLFTLFVIVAGMF